MRIPKYGGLNFTSWHLHFWSPWTVFTLNCPQLTADLTLKCSNGSMIHLLSHTTRKNPIIALKQLQTAPWIVKAFLILIDCEQTRYSFRQSFLMLKFLCKMVNTLPSDIFKVSAILQNFNLRSAFVHLHLKSAYHLSTICLDGVESG